MKRGVAIKVSITVVQILIIEVDITLVRRRLIFIVKLEVFITTFNALALDEWASQLESILRAVIDTRYKWRHSPLWIGHDISAVDGVSSYEFIVHTKTSTFILTLLFRIQNTFIHSLSSSLTDTRSLLNGYIELFFSHFFDGLLWFLLLYYWFIYFNKFIDVRRCEIDVFLHT